MGGVGRKTAPNPLLQPLFSPFSNGPLPDFFPASAGTKYGGNRLLLNINSLDSLWTPQRGCECWCWLKTAAKSALHGSFPLFSAFSNRQLSVFFRRRRPQNPAVTKLFLQIDSVALLWTPLCGWKLPVLVGNGLQISSPGQFFCSVLSCQRETNSTSGQIGCSKVLIFTRWRRLRQGGSSRFFLPIRRLLGGKARTFLLSTSPLQLWLKTEWWWSADERPRPCSGASKVKGFQVVLWQRSEAATKHPSCRAPAGQQHELPCSTWCSSSNVGIWAARWRASATPVTTTKYRVGFTNWWRALLTAATSPYSTRL